MDCEIKRTGLEKKFYEQLNVLIENLGYEIYDLDYLSNSKESRLRIFIKHKESLQNQGEGIPGERHSVDIEDCVKVDQNLTSFFDSSDWVPSNITLEVSSPGLFARIRDLRQLNWAKNKRVKLLLNKSFDELGLDISSHKNGKKNKDFIGILLRVEDDGQSILVEDENKSKHLIKLEDIKKANLEPII